MKNFRIGLSNLDVSKNEKYLLAVFVLFLISSVIFSPAPILGVYGLLKIFEFVALGVLIVINRNKFLDLLIKVLPFSIIFESGLAIMQFANRGSINGIFYFFGERNFNPQTPQIANTSINGELILRPYATFPHPNVLAAFLVISITLILVLSQKKAKINIWGFFSLSLGTVALILSFSRTAIMTYLLSLVIIILRNYAAKKETWKYVLSATAFVFAILFSALRFRFIPNLSDISIVDRKDLAIAGFKMIEKNPFFGVGLNNFLPELPNFFKGSENIFYIQPVHNLILLLMSQIGILPSLIILFFCVKLFLRTTFWGKLILFQLFILSMFDHYFLTIQQGQIILAIGFAMAFILEINARIRSNA